MDRFGREEGIEGERRKFQALYAHAVPPRFGGEKLFLVKPQTYMNRSGAAVRDLLGYFGAERESDLSDTLIVVHDDLDLPQGRIRLRARGSAGGHRGVASIISCLGHDRFARLKIGIGRDDRREASDYVLAPMDARSSESLDQAGRRALQALTSWIRSGIRATMNEFNGPADEPPPGAGEDRGDEAGR